jgi:hypothetical protein
MTVAEVPARQRYAGNGVTTQFSTVFTFLANSHVQVIHTLLDGSERILVEGGDYLLTGANTGAPGVVTTVSGVVPFGAYITIMRDVPFSQDFNGEILSNADAQDLETSYDKIWHGLQQLNEGLSRTLLSTPGGPGGPPKIEGWVPILAIVIAPPEPGKPNRAVLQVVDWEGGSGSVKPQAGLYLGPSGYVSNILDASDIRGPAGPNGPGTGDLLSTLNLADVANKIAARDNISVWGTDIPSSATVNLNGINGNIINITGTSTISAIVLQPGWRRVVRFTGSLILQHIAGLNLPGYAPIVTQANDWALFIGYTTGTFCVFYQRASGKAIVGPAAADLGLGTAATHPVGDFLQTANNLVDIPNKPAARTNLGLGTAAQYNLGNTASTVVYVAADGFLPSLDGRNLYNLPIPPGQPIPTSWVYPVGDLVMLTNISDYGAGGAGVPLHGYTSGGNLATFGMSRSAIGGGQYDIGYIQGPAPAGTWQNISGFAIQLDQAGYFVRVS